MRANGECSIYGNMCKLISPKQKIIMVSREKEQRGGMEGIETTDTNMQLGSKNKH